MKLFKIFLVIVLTHIISYSFAINISDIVKLTYDNNRIIKTLKIQLESVIFQSSITASEFLPNIVTEISVIKNNFYKIYTKPVHDKQRFLTLDFEQDIFSGGGTLVRLAKNNVNICLTYIKFNKEVNNIIYSAIKSYHNIVFYRLKIKLKQENIKKYNLFLKRIVTRYQYGASAKYDILYANAKLAKSKLDLFNTAIELQKHEDSFLSIVGIKAPKYLSKVNLIDFNYFSSKKSFIASSQSLNPEIVAKKLEIDNYSKEILLKKTILLPSLKMQFQGKKNLSQLDGWDYIITKHAFAIKLLIPVLLKGGGYHVDISLAKNILNAYKLHLGSINSLINAESNNMWNNFIRFRKIIKETILIKNYYQDTVKALEYQFINGAISIADLLDKQAEYNSSEIDNIEAEEVGYKLLLFDMYRHLGILPLIFKIY